MLNPNDLQRRLKQMQAPLGAAPQARPMPAPGLPGPAAGALNPNLRADLQRMQAPRAPQAGPAPASYAPLGAQSAGLGMQSTAPITSQPNPVQPGGAKTGGYGGPRPPAPPPAPTVRPPQGARDYQNFVDWQDPNAPLGGSRQMQHRLRQANTQLARESYPLLLENLRWLAEQARQDNFSPEGRAAFLAPAMEQLGDFEQQAAGNLARSNAARGLDNSSYDAALQGGLASQSAANRAAMVRQLYASEEQRKQMAQQALQQGASSLFNQGTRNATDIWQQLAQMQLQRDQMKQAGQFDLGSLIRMGMQAYGMSQGVPPTGGGGGTTSGVAGRGPFG